MVKYNCFATFRFSSLPPRDWLHRCCSFPPSRSRSLPSQDSGIIVNSRHYGIRPFFPPLRYTQMTSTKVSDFGSPSSRPSPLVIPSNLSTPFSAFGVTPSPFHLQTSYKYHPSLKSGMPRCILLQSDAKWAILQRCFGQLFPRARPLDRTSSECIMFLRRKRAVHISAISDLVVCDSLRSTSDSHHMPPNLDVH